MEFLVNIFDIAFYQPLFNALILLYQYLPGQDFGVAVIILTILIKLIFYPLGSKGIKSQKALQDLQPQIKELQEKFKDNKEQQMKATMELYKRAKVNPFSGILPLLIQLPILIALFRLFWKGFSTEQFWFLYGFVPHPAQIEATFLGILNLAQPSILLAVVTGIVQFLQTKMISPKAAAKKGPADFSQMMQKQMLYFFPIFTVFILWRLPSVMALYWLTTTLFTIGQQYIILKKNHGQK